MKNNKKSAIRAIVIAAVIIIPLLYSYFYLGAFWDPYSRLNSLPVAVVNEDEGAVINGEARNIGEELCNRLQDGADLKFILADYDTARTGTNGNEYYAMIVVPENFSADIASSSTTDKHTATITYSANEKRNYLASQILSRAVVEIEESLRSTVASEIVTTLADQINEVPDQMLVLQDGLGRLQEGAADLEEGTASLSKGTNEFHRKLSEYQSGISQLEEGSGSLTSGANSLDSGIDALLKGANQLTASTKNLGQLSLGAKSLADGAGELNTGIVQYTAGVDALISSVNSTSSFLKQYATTINPSIMKDEVFAAFISKLSAPANEQSILMLQEASSELKSASQQIAEGAKKLSAGCESLPQLKGAISTLSAGLSQAKEGSAKLAEGSKKLSSGAYEVENATTQLVDASAKIAEGATSAAEGTTQLSEGITTAKTGVDDAITDTNNRLDALDGLAEYAKAPVTVTSEAINAVPNYGTAFAPYFLSLSLWVGALIMFVAIYLDTEGKFRLLTSSSEHKVARSFVYLLIGFAQALVLAFVLQYCLGLKPERPLFYYASCCLVSMVFISIVQFLMVHLKDLGKFLSIVLLILQLTSCGGTFPMETVPKIFHVLYPFMPMTYSVGLFREVISGADNGEVVRNIVILLLILIVFMSLTIILSGWKARKAIRENSEEPIQA